MYLFPNAILPEVKYLEMMSISGFAGTSSRAYEVRPVHKPCVMNQCGGATAKVNKNMGIVIQKKGCVSNFCDRSADKGLVENHLFRVGLTVQSLEKTGLSRSKAGHGTTRQ
eukprot:397202-Amphidinium_carterae.1